MIWIYLWIGFSILGNIALHVENRDAPWTWNGKIGMTLTMLIPVANVIGTFGPMFSALEKRKRTIAREAADEKRKADRELRNLFEEHRLWFKERTSAMSFDSNIERRRVSDQYWNFTFRDYKDGKRLKI